MERTTPSGESNDIKQIKLIPPGCQTVFKYIITSNDLYFCYASTMTVNVFYNKNFQIKCILNPSIEKLIKCLCFNTGKSPELAAYYDQEILIFNVETESITERVKSQEVKFMEYNIDSKLLIHAKNQTLCYYDNTKKKVESIKTVDKVTAAKWYPFNGTELAYATNKSVSYHNINNKNRISGIDLAVKDGFSISELSWYTLDENYKYVLAGVSDGHTYLIDLLQSLVIMKFELYNSEVSSLIWLRHEPGTFLTFTKGTGRVAFWNVSKKNYNEIAKFSDSPVLYCIALQDPSRILLSLENGSIVIYDVKNRKPAFTLEPSHSETIFDLKYNPIRYGVFATCSYDSTIKVWDISENKIIWDLNVDMQVSRFEKKSSGGEQIEKSHIYCLKWSPNDATLFASGDNKGNLRIWGTEKQKLVTALRLNTQNEAQIIGIDWDMQDNIIVACQEWIYQCKFENEKLNLTKSFKTSSNLFQIKFNPFEPANYAVACMDNVVRVYSGENEKPTKTLTGHSKKVFGVSYNPKQLGILASTSDDSRIGIWDLEKNTNFFLTGHTNNTRHIVWLPDFSNILLSGSWDGSVRIWNIDLAACVGEINEHYSDVYGIDVSPHHPFLLTSCSRDNSIRFFNVVTSTSTKKLTESILNFQKMNVSILQKELPILEQRLKAVNNLDPVTAADLITNYFFYHDGLKDFWDIIKVITKQKEYCDLNNKVFFVTDLYSAYQSKVQQLEFNYYSKNKIDYSIRKEDLLKEASDLSAKLGDWEKFCELSIEANQWEKAIMAAPNVSISYWRDVTKKYADYCLNKNSHELKFASLLSNEVQPALKNFIETQDYEDAKIIWLTRGNKTSYTEPDRASAYTIGDSFLMNEETLNSIDKKLDNLPAEDGLFKIASTMAREHLIKGFPVLAAASFISIKDVFNTLKSLVRTAELELAFLVMKIFKDFTYEKDIMTGLLLKEIRRGGYDNLKLIIQSIPNLDVKIALTFFLKNFKKIKNNIFEEYNISLDEASNYFKSTGNDFLYFLVNNDVNSCAKIVYTKTDELSSRLSTNNKVDASLVNEIMNLLFYVKSIDLYSVENHQKFLLRLLAVSSFLEAINKNVKSCSIYLQEINRLLSKNSCKVDDSELVFLSFAIAFMRGEKAKLESEAIFPKNIKDINNFSKFYLKILENFRMSEDKSVLRYHCDYMGYFFCIRDEIFPVNISKVCLSTLNGKIIKGNPIRISNSILLTISQGLEWFKFSSISPLLDEYQLYNPY